MRTIWGEVVLGVYVKQALDRHADTTAQLLPIWDVNY